MRRKSRTAAARNGEKFTDSYPVKLTEGQFRFLEDLQRMTPLNRSQLMRLGLSYFFEQVKTGKLDIFDLLKQQSQAKAA